ncbi:NAD-dependent methanol dehydrogenase [Anatilimnocola aggregata]|uniref:NAD-dependent methanol dehydrogenase n=1 Tax=Anatilimnocola aggregata TaxID=2528021 RepID=A0A517YIL2_9BACT|nr:iron-containing alcohol dehydrogenase [Anatilimnocola aggregata]QDU30054.1 NAD-dependent methanol dehydrogenase [Anatilimnocola aggregata]
MRNTWTFHSAGQLIFGNGAVNQLGQRCLERNWQRVLVVTDQHLVKAGIAPRVDQLLREADLNVQVFDQGAAEPSVALAVQLAEQAKAFSPDAIVGLGGGSNMDLAKIAAVIVTHGGPPSRYFSFNNVPGPVLPIIGVPTTAGTGSEVSHAAVLTDTENHIKVSTLSNHLRPTLAVVDPELTYTCPPKVTADSGIDALTHAIEALTAIDYSLLPIPPEDDVAYCGAHPLGGCLAEKAIELVGLHLATAVADGSNRAAREGMALASTLAGLAFSNCAVALVHALEYPLGAVLHCSHGAGNGLLLPYVMRFNLPERTSQFARIARLLGEDTRGTTEPEAAERAIFAVERLRARIGIPARIRELGGTREQLPTFASKAYAIKRLRDVNPRVASEQDLLAILEAAF